MHSPGKPLNQRGIGRLAMLSVVSAQNAEAHSLCMRKFLEIECKLRWEAWIIPGGLNPRIMFGWTAGSRGLRSRMTCRDFREVAMPWQARRIMSKKAVQMHQPPGADARYRGVDRELEWRNAKPVVDPPQDTGPIVPAARTGLHGIGPDDCSRNSCRAEHD